MVALLAFVIGLADPTPVAERGPQFAGCFTEVGDSDRDGLSDICEAALLERFAPAFVASPHACNWDQQTGRIRGAYLVAAEPIEGGVRLAYLPAYQMDCGWAGPKCLVRLQGGCEPHAGDSEAIFVDLVVDGGTGEWRATRVFLSAHCFGGSDGRCRWFEHGALRWVGDAPVVWVAEGKNGNYPSKAACDSGHWGYDTCDRNTMAYRFPVASARQNIGSFAYPFPHRRERSDCIADPELLDLANGDQAECIWTAATFRGWSDAQGPAATGYRRYLREVAGFIPTGTG